MSWTQGSPPPILDFGPELRNTSSPIERETTGDAPDQIGDLKVLAQGFM